MMKNDTDLVSIIMPLYNAEKFVSASIFSILSQTYENWELIVVDDCSTDNSFTIVQEFRKQDSRIQLHQMSENSGVAKARNHALKVAKGKYISFLDSDDIWKPEKLYTQITFMQNNELALTYSSYDTIDGYSKYINTRHSQPKITYEDMLKSNHIGNLTGIYDVEYFGKVYFDEVGHEDYVMWLHLLKKIPFTKGIEEPLAQYRVLSSSISSNKIKALVWQWHIYREVEKLNFFQSFYYFGHYVYNAVKKRT